MTMTPKQKKNSRKAILIRDGIGCFYCGEPMQNPTLEHLVNKCDGGKNNRGNLVLAHLECNQFVGNASLITKLKLRDLLRTKEGKKIFLKRVFNS